MTIATATLDRVETRSGTRLHGPIILATDGTTASNPAFTAARLLAERDDAEVRVLAILEPQSLLVPSPDPLASFADAAASRAAVLHARVRQQLQSMTEPDTDWPVEIALGSPPALISRAARERHARLIVTGARRHRALERMLGDETPLHLARMATVPLLVAAPELTRLPERIVVATDLSPVGLEAARLAIALFPSASTVFLVHVLRSFADAEDGSASEDRSRTRAALEADGAALGLPHGMQVHVVTPAGDPAREIVDFAEYSNADLVVVGSRRGGAIRRLFLGSVSSHVLRDATCSVLVMPATYAGGSAHDAIADQQTTEHLVDRRDWADALARLTRRNVGRRTLLEIDDLAVGAQTQEMAYPFSGVTYDRHDDAITLFFGEPRRDRPHLAHRVPRPTSIDLLRAENGSDHALRIGYEGGQALIAFPA